MISGDAYASENKYTLLIQKAYKDRNDKYGQWHPLAVSGTRLRDGKEWKVANAVIGGESLGFLKNTFQEYIKLHLPSASSDQLKWLVLGYLARPQYALAHRFIKANDYEGLATLLQITGPEILLIPNDEGRYPLSSADLSNFEQEIQSYLPADVKIAEKLKTIILPALLRENFEALITEINDFKMKHDEELKKEEFWGDKRTELEKKQREFNKYCEKLRLTSEGRKLLRDYRFPDGKSLISYYIKEHQKEQDWYEKQLLRTSLQLAMSDYFEDDVPIAAEVVDISDLDSLRTFMSAATGEEAKKVFSQYRNSKGRNLAQLVLILEEEESSKIDTFYQLKGLINDNEAFLSLLRQADPGAKSAEEMIANEKWGVEFLKQIDPSIWVRPGKFGVTPLMKEALKTHEDLQTLLDYLHNNKISTTQTDLFGNTVESIRRFVTSNSFYDYEEFLVESLKRRPLQESLWAEYFDSPYFETHGRIVEISEILDIVHQQHQTDLHRAFLQVKVNDDQAQATVNGLWRSLFKAYDDREDHDLAERRAWVQQNGYYSEIQELEKDSPSIAEERKLSTAERALKFLSVEKEQEGVANMLASGGTFGINFSRTVSPSGGRIMWQKCTELGKRFYEEMFPILKEVVKHCDPAHLAQIVIKDFGLDLTATDIPEETSFLELIEKLKKRFNKPDADAAVLFREYLDEKTSIYTRTHLMLKDSLFQDFGAPLDSAQEEKLLNHRLNCAVVALFAMSRFENELSIASDEDQIFVEIDYRLQSFVPAGQKVNSKDRYERLNSLYGDGDVW